MSTDILFLLIGLGAGAVYALLSLGLVLEFRAGGVVNFAHGAIAMFMAYVYVNLTSAGELVFPWRGIPDHVSVASSSGIGTWPALVICLVYAAILGLVVDLVIFRPLRNAPALAKVGASVGLLLVLQTMATLNFGAADVSAPPLFQTGTVSIAGLNIPANGIWLAAISIAMAILLAAMFRFTRFGLTTRAAADNSRGALLIGLSPGLISAWNWMIASMLAAVAGILILPITSLTPGAYSLFIIPALAAALIGRFRSFGLATGTGLVIGMVQSLLVEKQVSWTWIPSGLGQALPFLVIVVLLALRSPSIPGRGTIDRGHNPRLGHPSRPVLTAGAWFVVGLVGLVLLTGEMRVGLISSLVIAIVCLSAVVITGFVGQVSLAQMTFAGLGAFLLAHLTNGLGLGFPIAPLIAALGAAAGGFIVGLPAVRIRGVNLAIVTLAAATAADAVLFGASWFAGGAGTLSVGSPTLFGWNLGIYGSHTGDYPRLIFGVLVLVIVVVIALFVVRLRRSSAGRMFIAVRSNEMAAAAMGVDVPATKLVAFSLSAFIAGLGGAMLAYQQTTISAESFETMTSLTLLAIVYVGGISRISGAFMAAITLSASGLAVTLLNKAVDFGAYQPLVAGIGLIVIATTKPDGLAGDLPDWARLRSISDRLLGRPPAGKDGEPPSAVDAGSAGTQRPSRTAGEPVGSAAQGSAT
jgi:branched-subunit amino acid ABC-type transport system permease component